MNIRTVQDFGRALRAGPYTSVGCYPVFFLTADGDTLSFVDAWDNRADVVRAILDGSDPQWRVVGVDVNWESELHSAHSYARIESAYAEDGADGAPQDIPASYRAWRARCARR